jgi:hypothetical protein
MIALHIHAGWSALAFGGVIVLIVATVFLALILLHRLKP